MKSFLKKWGAGNWMRWCAVSFDYFAHQLQILSCTIDLRARLWVYEIVLPTLLPVCRSSCLTQWKTCSHPKKAFSCSKNISYKIYSNFRCQIQKSWSVYHKNITHGFAKGFPARPLCYLTRFRFAKIFTMVCGLILILRYENMNIS